MRKTPIILPIVAKSGGDAAEQITNITRQWSSQQSIYVISVNTADEPLTIEMVRNLKQDLIYGTTAATLQVVVLQQLERASIAAQNALLKTLEEPPENTQIIITSKFPSKLLPTIVSRCLVVEHTAANVVQTQEEGAAQADAYATYLKVKKADIAEKISIAQQHKEREVALAFCENLMQVLVVELEKKESQPNIVVELQQLLITRDLLQKNSSVALTMDALFFKL